MAKQSAGILLYRKREGKIEVLLVHPGGPFWAKKDVGSWSLPKGEYQDYEDAMVAAQREFKEETGFDTPAFDQAISLGEVKYGNKVVKVWAIEGSIDARRVSSNTFTMEWPPRTGRMQEFPEVDRAGWFEPQVARQKLVKGQVAFIDRFCDEIDMDTQGSDVDSTQMSLL